MKKAAEIFVVIALMISSNLFAHEPRKTDVEGSSDYLGLSRYKGAIIQEYNIINYGEFYFGLSEPIRKDFGGRGQFFEKYLDVKGKIMNNQYLIPITEGVLQVYENYKNALTIAGYNILYIEHNKNSCFWREDYGYFSKAPEESYGVDCDKDYYNIVAKGVKDSIDVYVELYIGTGGNWGQSFVIVNQSIVEAVPLKLGLVKADNISQNIEFSGHSIFYNIHFASGSFQIETNSNNQMKQIADYLNAHKDKKFFIVGHTDNVGDFTSNMTLSENRAKAVMNDLITKYGVNKEQLKAYGDASLSPVTSNTTDGGKARNRRVEIVEQ
ncbi:MAG: OmpA family protein [Chlorobi bacterium]|nr:OmpA family protein [Chlorobiota bacterium]